MHDLQCGDDRCYNNLFVQSCDLTPYDAARLPVWMDGNVFLGGAKPSKHETNPLVKRDFDPGLKLVKKPDGYYLEMRFDKSWTTKRTRQLVTTHLLGKAKIPNLPYENSDGSPLAIDTDYFNKPRNPANPTPGPFAHPGAGQLDLKVW